MQGSTASAAWKWRSVRWLAFALTAACAPGQQHGNPSTDGAADVHSDGGVDDVSDRPPPLPEGGGAGGAAGGGGGGGGGGSPNPDAAGGSAGASSDAGYLTGLEKTQPYPAAVYPTENPFSPEKATLGKILFWEEQLSSKDTHACGTCHRPSAGGSDPRSVSDASFGAGPNGMFGDADDARGSQGVARCDSSGSPTPDPTYGLEVQITPRKAPSVLDAWFFDELLWDGRAKTSFVDPVTGAVAIQSGGALESQAAGPPVSSAEMSCEGHSWTAVESKLGTAVPLKLASQIPQAMSEAIAAHPSYPALFQWVYGTPEITARRILFAIATYERQLRSDQTPWDRYNAGESDALTADQEAGLSVFNLRGRCNKCHIPPMFTDNKFHNTGAQAPSLDGGRSIISGDAVDLGKMKTSGLRNVGLRADGGLLHNGTGNGATLLSVLSAYREGGVFHENTDPEIEVLNLREYEFQQLLEFVQNGLTDPRVRDELPPFDRPRLRSER
jgi:cytochrome c peroxidase